MVAQVPAGATRMTNNDDWSKTIVSDPIKQSRGKPRSRGVTAGMAQLFKRATLTALMLMVGMMMANAQDASGEGPEAAQMKAALKLFATRSYDEILDGVDAVAGSGAEHAGKVLTLLSRRRVYVGEDGASGAFRDGKDYFDFVTGTALSGKPEGVSGVRVNNRVRNAVKAAVGTLRLRARILLGVLLRLRQ